MDSAQFGVLLRLLIAAVLGGVVGLERQLQEKSAGPRAGLRAHMLTALAAALFVALGGVAVRYYDAALPGAPLAADPTRVFSAIVVGMSLITAGVILRGRSLTTGASLLVTAGVGSAAGLEQYVIAGGAALLALIVNIATGRLERRTPHDEPPGEEIGEEEPLREL